MSAKHEPNAQQVKDEKLYLQMGMTDEEFALAEEMLGRLPNYTETGLFSALWSEHCSYKSSKPVLRKFPTEGERVLQGPGKGLESSISVITKRLFSKWNLITRLLQLSHSSVRQLARAECSAMYFQWEHAL